jgi:hypothetical protein
LSEQKLTLEAQAAIRQYLAKLLIPTGVTVAIGAFVLGFFVNDVARKDAFNNAYIEASQMIQNLTKESSISVTEARVLKEQAEKTENKISEILKDIESTRQKLKTAEAFQKSEELVSELALRLASSSDFKRQALDDFGVLIDNLESRITKAEIKVSPLGEKWSKCEWVEVGYDKTHGADDSNWCPSGAYISKLDFDSNSDGVHSPYVGRASCCSP